MGSVVSLQFVPKSIPHVMRPLVAPSLAPQLKEEEELMTVIEAFKPIATKAGIVGIRDSRGETHYAGDVLLRENDILELRLVTYPVNGYLTARLAAWLSVPNGEFDVAAIPSDSNSTEAYTVGTATLCDRELDIAFFAEANFRCSLVIRPRPSAA